MDRKKCFALLRDVGTALNVVLAVGAIIVSLTVFRASTRQIAGVGADLDAAALRLLQETGSLASQLSSVAVQLTTRLGEVNEGLADVSTRLEESSKALAQTGAILQRILPRVTRSWILDNLMSAGAVEYVAAAQKLALSQARPLAQKDVEKRITLLPEGHVFLTTTGLWDRAEEVVAKNAGADIPSLLLSIGVDTMCEAAANSDAVAEPEVVIGLVSILLQELKAVGPR